VRSRLFLATAIMAGFQASAWACAPPVTLPYSNAREHQEWMWSKAESVVVVRLVEFNRRDPALSAEEWRERRSNGTTGVGVTLEPVRWLKGQGSPTPFRMPKGGTGDCIPTSGWDAGSAKVGDSFVAYFLPGTIAGETLLGGFVPEEMVEPHIKALLGLPQ
jgi:hypothetical protein